MNYFKEILFLSNIKGIGPVSLNKRYIPQLSQFSDFEDFLEAIDTFLPPKFQDKDILERAFKETEEVADQVLELDITPLTVFDNGYPARLRDLSNKMPPILYVRGNADCLGLESLGVVGTREPAWTSRDFEREFVREVLERTHRVIVSGLAIGCDTIAHQTAVDFDERTIAVLPGGVGKIVPPQNRGLAEKIVETGGCLVSAYRPLERVHRTAYVTRDQYTAALSDCCFVVQCSLESGTMYTVNYAQDLGRKLACFFPENAYEFDFEGNMEILNENGFEVSGLGDIDEFIEFLD